MPYGRGTLRILPQRFLYQGRPTLLLYAKRKELDATAPSSQKRNITYKKVKNYSNLE
jgi:hypothetical protein